VTQLQGGLFKGGENTVVIPTCKTGVGRIGKMTLILKLERNEVSDQGQWVILGRTRPLPIVHLNSHTHFSLFTRQKGVLKQ
jgi:hypothetical protein